MNTNFFSKKKIIVTGASGFIGSHLVKYLASKKLNVTGYYRTETDRLSLLNIKKYSKIINSYNDIPKGNNFILIHTAQSGQVQLRSDTNQDVDQNLIKMLINKNFSLYIFLSSALVYGDKYIKKISEENKTNANNHYAKIKLKSESLFDLKKTAILRLTNVYGNFMNKENIFCDIISQLPFDRSIKIRDGSPVREFLFIEDLCYLIFLVLKNPITGIFNLGSNESISIKNLAILIAKKANKKKINIVETNKKNIKSNILLNSEKIMNKLPWKPKVKLKRGILDLIKLKS